MQPVTPSIQQPGRCLTPRVPHHPKCPTTQRTHHRRGTNHPRGTHHPKGLTTQEDEPPKRTNHPRGLVTAEDSPPKRTRHQRGLSAPAKAPAKSRAEDPTYTSLGRSPRFPDNINAFYHSAEGRSEAAGATTELCTPRATHPATPIPKTCQPPKPPQNRQTPYPHCRFIFSKPGIVTPTHSLQ